MKNGRINERNMGDYKIDGGLKKRTAPKKTTISLTNEELTMMRYFVNQVINNIELDASDMDDQVYRDNGNVLIQFSRDRMEDVRSLMDKLNK
mgnify:CR=1 FL=1